MILDARGFREGLSALVFPHRCSICGEWGEEFICESCVERIERVPAPFCVRCGCRNCRSTPDSFAAVRAVALYRGVMKEAVSAFKYRGQRVLADPLAKILHAYLVESADIPWGRADRIVPVAMYRDKERQRGYNQSRLLAERLSALSGIPLLPNAVHRVRTAPQAWQAAQDRAANVLGAFNVPDPSPVRGSVILLVDDVCTTRSTLHECSLALTGAGARVVYAVCLACGA